MKKWSTLFFLLAGLQLNAQTDATGEAVSKEKEPDYIWIFSSPRLINANTVELIPKGILEFRVTHNFGDVAGSNGGIKNFFGLDNATDVRIGFQYGLSKRINLVAARAKGGGTISLIALRQLYEVGVKYRILQQTSTPGNPLSITLFANNVISTMKSDTAAGRENSFDNFSDRMSQTLQLMIARKIGPVSVQISPTLINRNYVVNGDDKALFALGGALRIPVKGRFSLLFDYFHPFRSQESEDLFKAQDIRFYDAMGIGVEFLTEGHVFHLNFTNATEIMENRFIPRTVTSWGKGQYRWGFTVSRDFNLLYKRKNRK